MSKEQTPITAQEYYKNFEHIPLTKGIVVELMELYANKVTQAKVLEALESDRKQYDIDCGGRMLVGIEVKGSEVKILGALDGYGNGLSLDEIKLKQK